MLDFLSKAWDFAQTPFVSDVAIPGLVSIYQGNQASRAVGQAGQQQVAGYQRGIEELGTQYEYGKKQLRPYSRFGRQGLRGYNELMKDPSQITSDPGYQFRYEQGLEGLNRSMAARRGLISGATLEGVQEYGQQYAMDEYDRALSRRALQIEAGLRSAGTLAELGKAYGEGVAGLYGDIGTTQGAATLGQSAAQQGQLSDILNLWQQYRQGKKASDLVSGARSTIDQLTTAGGGNPLSALNLAGKETLSSTGSWADLGASPNTVSSMSSLYAAPGTRGEFAAFSDAPFSSISEYGIGAPTASTGTTAGVSGNMVGLGVLGAGLAAAMLHKTLKGGSSNSAKSNEYMAYFNRSPEEGMQNLNNIITGKKWSGSAGDIASNINLVVKHALDNDIITPEYPALWSKKSVVDIFNLPSDEEWETLQKASESNGGMVAMWKGNTVSMQVMSELKELRDSLVGDSSLKKFAKQTYSKIRDSGYTGDLSKLEQYLGTNTVKALNARKK